MKKYLCLVFLLFPILYGCEKNVSPIIHNLSFLPESPFVGDTVLISAMVSDENGDALSLNWSCQEGSFLPELPNKESSIYWVAPELQGYVSITLEISDGELVIEKGITIEVQMPLLSFTDSRDGKDYSYVAYGTQSWMTQNLAYLPSVNKLNEGSEGEDFHYYVYGYDGNDVEDAKEMENFNKHGVLYNFHAALRACPSGWHLPSDSEWKELEQFFGMSQEDSENRGYRNSGEVGYKLKLTSGWNDSSNNSSGFSAIPSGDRNDNGNFYNIGSRIHFWTATGNSLNSWIRYLDGNKEGVYRSDKRRDNGFSVRCIKDE